MTRRIIQFIAMAGTLALVVWAALRLDWSSLTQSLRDLDHGIWLLAVAVGAAWKLAAKAARSHVLTRAVARARKTTPPSLATTTRQYVGTHAVGQLLWPPVGMSLRTVGLVREGMSVVGAAQVQVGERIAEAVALVAMAALTAILAPGALAPLFGAASTAIIVAAVVVAMLGVAFALASSRVRRAWAAGWRPLLWASLWAFVSHVGDVVMLLIAARAAHVPVELAPALVAFLAVNTAAIIPLVPGQLGVLEAAVVLGLAYGGIPAEPALVVALAYRAAYLVPLIVVGLPLVLVEARRQAARGDGAGSGRRDGEPRIQSDVRPASWLARLRGSLSPSRRRSRAAASATIAICIAASLAFVATPARADQPGSPPASEPEVTAEAYIDPAIARFVSWTDKLWPGSREASTRIGELIAIAELIREHNPPRGVEWLAFGTGTVGAAAGQGTESAGIDSELAIGGEVALAGKECQLIAVGGQGVLATSGDGRFASAEQWARLCPWMGLPIKEEGWDTNWFPFKIYGHLSQRVRPSFGARRLVTDETYDTATYGVEVVGGQIYYANRTRRVNFAGISAQDGWVWQDLGEGRQSRYFTNGEFWFVRFDGFREQPDVLAHRSIDVLAIGFNANRDDNGAAVIDIMPVRLRGMSLGSPYLLWDLEVGGTFTGTVSTEVGVDGEPVSEEVVETENLPDVTAGVVRASVYGGTTSRNVGVAFDRTLAPTASSELVLEDRVSAWSRWAGDRSELDLRAFVGRTIVWPDRFREEEFTTGGAMARFHYNISDGMSLGADAEIGRSFYAPAQDGEELGPGFGYRLVATLTLRRFGSRMWSK